MTVDVRGYLLSKGIHLKNADRRNVHCACFWCGEDPRKRGRLYINVDEDADIPGLFMCHRCGERGSLKKIKRYFGDPVDDQKDPGVAFYEVLHAAAGYYHQALNDHSRAVSYFEQERGLNRETIKKFRLGWADGNVTPFLKQRGFSDDEIRGAGLVYGGGSEFFNNVFVIPYYFGTTCVGLRQKEPGGKYRQPSGWTQRLFNLDALQDADEIVITEGEFDCMVAEQLGFSAVACPGASQWQESWNDYFKKAKRVWVVFDNDEAGRLGADKICASLGPKAKPAIIPPQKPDDYDDHNDISDWVVHQGHTAEDFAELLRKNRATLLVTVAEAMGEWRSVQGVEGIKFGFEKLDTLINPGLLPGQVVVTLAKTNTGKTIWLENTFERMAQADPELNFLFMSLEQTRGEWFERAQRIRALYRLDLAPTSFDDEEMAAFDRRIQQETFDWWSPRLMLTDKNRMGEEHIRETLDDYRVEMGRLPDVLAIDYLGYLARGFPGKDRYEKTSEAIMVLKEIAKDYQVPILTPHQVNRSGAFGQRLEIDMARDAGAVEETGDFVFVLWNPDHNKDPGEPRTGRINMHIGKSRHGGKGEEVYYQWGPHSLTMIPEDDRGHLSLALAELGFPKVPWQRAMCEHRTGHRF